MTPSNAPSPAGNLQPEKPASHGAALQRGHGNIPTSYQERYSAGSTQSQNPLDGFCPVALRDKEAWVAGRADLEANFGGQKYQFSSAAARQKFLANPQEYVPVRRGNDVVLAIEENRTVPGSIQHSAVWQGRLYLFSSTASLAAFRGDPARYVERADTASEQQAVRQKPLPSLQLPADSL